ncbi:hypothetical protein D3A96_10800 [Robertkochia marina]|nr:hypothetical protein D3A96_10800 [Robertkochia marina]
MLQFFKKKQSILPLLRGLSDIHNHVLPGIDDGSRNPEESKKMLLLYRELGFQKVYCTPHIMEDYFHLNKEKITTTRNSFFEGLSPREQQLTLHPAAEHLMDGQFEKLLEEDSFMPLKDNYILVETGFMARPMNLDEMIFKMNTKGLTPAFAHPERYGYLKTLKHFKELKDRGMTLQLNLLSLNGHYGKTVQQKAEMLLKEGLYDFVGTDAHKPMHLEIIGDMRVFKEVLGPLKGVVERTNEVFG